MKDGLTTTATIRLLILATLLVAACRCPKPPPPPVVPVAVPCHLESPPAELVSDPMLPGEGACPVDATIAACLSPRVAVDLAVYVLTLRDYAERAWTTCAQTEETAP